MEKSEKLERALPRLVTEGYRVTSEKSPVYNCFAWAGDVDDSWWEPVVGDYWPSDVPIMGKLQDFIQLYEKLGYEVCESAQLESEYDKIALYQDTSGNALHAAKQLDTGAWTSKCGGLEDIEHATMTAVEGPDFGKVGAIMSRRKAMKPERLGT